MSTRRPDALRQLLPRRDLRRAPRDRRAGTAPASTTRGGRPRASSSAPAGTLRAQPHEPIRVVDVRAAGHAHGAVRRASSSTTSARTSTGWAEIGVQAPAGTAVEVFYSEKLGADGRASTDGNDLVLGQLQTDYYVAKGAGEERWRPRFTYKGFQYVQLSGPGGQPLPADVVGQRRSAIQQVRSDLPRTSSLRDRRSATLDRIHRNTIVGDPEQPARHRHRHAGLREERLDRRRAAHGRHRVDPVRHRAALPEAVPGHARRADGRRASCRCSRRPTRTTATSASPRFKPVDCCGATPAWDAFWFVIPWESYRATATAARSSDVSRRCSSYLDEWIPRWTDKDGDTYAHTLTAGLGDWVPPNGVPTVNALSSTAYYAHFARIASDVGARAGPRRRRGALRRAVRERSARTSTRASSARTACTARRRASRTCRPRRSCRSRSASCPDARRAAVARAPGRRHRGHARRQRLGRRARARATCCRC